MTDNSKIRSQIRQTILDSIRIPGTDNEKILTCFDIFTNERGIDNRNRMNLYNQFGVWIDLGHIMDLPVRTEDRRKLMQLWYGPDHNYDNDAVDDGFRYCITREFLKMYKKAVSEEHIKNAVIDVR